MAGAKMTCRVCGKEYEACRSARTVPGVFRWQEVACSPECGAIYLSQIRESRAEQPKKNKKKRARAQHPAPIIEPIIEPVVEAEAPDEVIAVTSEE